MSARAVAEAEVLRLLEAPPSVMKPLALAQKRTGIAAPPAKAPPPVALRQRGRTGTAATPWTAGMHPRGAHGQFTFSNQPKPTATAATSKADKESQAAAKRVEGERKTAEAKAAKRKSTAGQRKAEAAKRRSESRAEARYTAQQQVEKLHSGQAWTGKLNVNENLTPGMGVGKNAKPSPAVALLQNKLQALGYGANTATDGKYGPQTEVAVRQLQREHGLRPTGAVGPLTMQLLEQLTQRSLQWQKQGIIEAQMLPGESVAAYARCVLSAAMTCR